MKVAFQNVRGLNSSVAEVTQALTLHRPDVMCLTETWGCPAIPTAWEEMGYKAQHVGGTVCEGRNRLGGGITILLKIPHERVSIMPNKDMAAVAVQTEDYRIIALYIRPAIGQERYKRCLQQLLEWSRGKSIIVGDWNARARWWDTTTTPAGTVLSTWAIRHNFSVGFPPTATCVTPRGSSTVDLILARGWRIPQTKILFGPWNNKSDHKMVSGVLVPAQHTQQTRIPPYIFQEAKAVETARNFYNIALPEIEQRISMAETARDLQNATDSLVKCLHKPWQAIRSPRSPRFRPGWTQALDDKAKMRTKLLKGNEVDRERGRHLDRAIKREYRANKRRLHAQAGLQCGNEYQQALKTLRFLKNRPIPDSAVDPETFTRYIDEKQTHKPHIPLRRFSVPGNFRTYVQRALNTSKSGKAAGPDGITNEMLKISPAIVADTLVALWTKVGAIQYVPSQLNAGTLVPLFKQGDKHDPSNFRPIMLLSHIRKTITGAIGLAIRDEYTPHRHQWGFTPHTSTEDAILAAQESIQNGHKYLAVLDLTAAYDSVRRDDIFQVCQASLPRSISDMIPAIIQPMKAKTKLQCSELSADITMGVPQGDRPSPDLFNMFMDTLLNRLDAIPRSLSEHPANAYADDILLLSKSASGLQELLDIATVWSQQFHMRWNISKSSIMNPGNVTHVPTLNTETVKTCNEATYLGVTISSEGVTDTQNIARVDKAMAIAKQVRHLNPIPLAARRTLSLALLYGTLTYGITTFEPTIQLLNRVTRFDEEVLPWILGVGKPKRPQDIHRMRALARVSSLLVRREQLLLTRIVKLNRLITDRNTSTPLPVNIRRKAQLNRLQQQLRLQHGTNQRMHTPIALEEWKRANNTTRRIPGISRQGPPILTDTKIGQTARRTAMLWYLHRFPRRSQVFSEAWINKWRVIMEREAPPSQQTRRTISMLMTEI